MTNEAHLSQASQASSAPVVASHRNNFNLIRLIAAIQVLIVHCCTHYELSGWYATIFKAFPGVPVFFFISGFLIYQAYERSRDKGPAAFFRNRFLRIYPALWVCVILSTLAVAATGYFAVVQPGAVRLLTWVAGQMTIVQFYNPDFMRAFGDGVLNGALWTIAVEVQFYVLIPILALLLARWKLVFLGLLIVSIGANQVLHHVLNPDVFSTKLLGVTFAPWVYMFMTGMLAARYWRHVMWITKTPLLLIALVYLASMFLIGGYELNAQNSINPVSFLLISAMVVKLAFMPLGPLEGALAAVQRNDISYGTYLYHMPVINLVLYIGMPQPASAVMITLVTTIILATLSWFLVERTALRLKR